MDRGAESACWLKLSRRMDTRMMIGAAAMFDGKEKEGCPPRLLCTFWGTFLYVIGILRIDLGDVRSLLACENL